jgi:hypothetical protein
LFFRGDAWQYDFSEQAFARTIYGIENAKQFNGSPKGEFYIQAESFLSKSRANQYQLFLQSKMTYPASFIMAIIIR